MTIPAKKKYKKKPIQLKFITVINLKSANTRNHFYELFSSDCKKKTTNFGKKYLHINRLNNVIRMAIDQQEIEKIYAFLMSFDVTVQMRHVNKL